jgi:hypothetical protein
MSDDRRLAGMRKTRERVSAGAIGIGIILRYRCWGLCICQIPDERREKRLVVVAHLQLIAYTRCKRLGKGRKR